MMVLTTGRQTQCLPDGSAVSPVQDGSPSSGWECHCPAAGEDMFDSTRTCSKDNGNRLYGKGRDEGLPPSVVDAVSCTDYCRTNHPTSKFADWFQDHPTTLQNAQKGWCNCYSDCSTTRDVSHLQLPSCVYSAAQNPPHECIFTNVINAYQHWDPVTSMCVDPCPTPAPTKAPTPDCAGNQVRLI